MLTNVVSRNRAARELHRRLVDQYFLGPESGTDQAWQFLESGDELEELLAGEGSAARRGPRSAGSSVPPLPIGVGEASPASITGVNVTIQPCEGSKVTGGLDWLAVAGPAETVPEVTALVSNTFGSYRAAEKRTEWNQYGNQCLVWETGATVWPGEKGQAFLQLSGESMGHLPEYRLMRFVVKLADLGWGLAGRSRFDPNINVDPDLMPMRAVMDAEAAGHYRGFRTSYSRTDRFRSGRLKGEMSRFGRRGSGKHARVYNKTLESRGKIRANRVELELVQDWGRAFWKHLVAACRTARIGAVSALCARAVSGMIDFTDGDGAHRHADRMKRLPWWQAVQDAIRAGPLDLTAVPSAPSLERFLVWMSQVLCRKISAAAAVADRMGYGGRQFLHDLMDSMRDRGDERNELGGGPPLGFGVDLAAVLAGRAPPGELPI